MDTDALADLVRAHQAMVWRYLRLLGGTPEEADDLTQDAFVRAAEALRDGEELRHPKAYLRSVARNALIGRRRRRQPLDLDWADAVDGFVAHSPTALDDDRIDALRHCLTRLGPRARQALEWHHVEGIKYRDAAARLGIGAQGFKSMLARARTALRACIEQQMHGDES